MDLAVHLQGTDSPTPTHASSSRCSPKRMLQSESQPLNQRSSTPQIRPRWIESLRTLFRCSMESNRWTSLQNTAVANKMGGVNPRPRNAKVSGKLSFVPSAIRNDIASEPKITPSKAMVLVNGDGEAPLYLSLDRDSLVPRAARHPRRKTVPPASRLTATRHAIESRRGPQFTFRA